MIKLLAIKSFFGKYLVAGLLIALSGLFIYHLLTVGTYKLDLASKNVIIAKREQKIGSLQDQAAALIAANEGFKASAATQNNAVENLMNVITMNQKEAIDAINAASIRALKYKKSYDAILNAKNVGDTPCNALNSRFNQYIELRQKEITK